MKLKELKTMELYVLCKCVNCGTIFVTGTNNDGTAGTNTCGCIYKK